MAEQQEPESPVLEISPELLTKFQQKQQANRNQIMAQLNQHMDVVYGEMFDLFVKEFGPRSVLIPPGGPTVDQQAVNRNVSNGTTPVEVLPTAKVQNVNENTNNSNNNETQPSNIDSPSTSTQASTLISLIKRKYITIDDTDDEEDGNNESEETKQQKVDSAAVPPSRDDSCERKRRQTDDGDSVSPPSSAKKARRMIPPIKPKSAQFTPSGRRKPKRLADYSHAGKVSAISLVCTEEGCGFICPDIFALHEHQLRTHQISKYRCYLCKAMPSFPNRQQLNQHLSHDHSNVHNWQCSKCPQFFRGHDILHFHTVACHHDGHFKCTRCDFSAELRIDVINHFNRIHQMSKEIKQEPWASPAVVAPYPSWSLYPPPLSPRYCGPPPPPTR